MSSFRDDQPESASRAGRESVRAFWATHGLVALITALITAFVTISVAIIANRVVDNSKSSAAPSPTSQFSSPRSTASAETTGETSVTSGQYRQVYSGKRLTVPFGDCVGTLVDLDQPLVDPPSIEHVDDLRYGDCGLDRAWSNGVAITTSPSMSPDQCLSLVQTSPIPETIENVPAKLGLCVQTDKGRIAFLRAAVDPKTKALFVAATLWE